MGGGPSALSALLPPSADRHAVACVDEVLSPREGVRGVASSSPFCSSSAAGAPAGGTGSTGLERELAGGLSPRHGLFRPSVEDIEAPEVPLALTAGGLPAGTGAPYELEPPPAVLSRAVHAAHMPAAADAPEAQGFGGSAAAGPHLRGGSGGGPARPDLTLFGPTVVHGLPGESESASMLQRMSPMRPPLAHSLSEPAMGGTAGAAYPGSASLPSPGLGGGATMGRGKALPVADLVSMIASGELRAMVAVGVCPVLTGQPWGPSPTPRARATAQVDACDA